MLRVYLTAFRGRYETTSWLVSRAWEAKMSSPSYTLDMFVEHFRAICDAVILHCVQERTQKTQAASLLLDHGNARFAAMERSSGQDPT